MSQIDIFCNSIPQKTGINTKEGLTISENEEYIFYLKIFSKSENDSLLLNLRINIVCKLDSMNIYVKKIDFPRLTTWYDNNVKPYSFSGISLQSLHWSNEILSIKRKIKSVAKTAFNIVLLNLFRDGNDFISWHTDPEKELVFNPVIASVKF